MEFKKIDIFKDGTSIEGFFINEKEVDEKTYYSLLDDDLSKYKNVRHVSSFDNSEDIEVCSRCNDIMDLVISIRESESEEVAFDELYEFLDTLESVAHQEGIIENLRDNSSLLNQIAEQMEADLNEEED